MYRYSRIYCLKEILLIGIFICDTKQDVVIMDFIVPVFEINYLQVG